MMATNFHMLAALLLAGLCVQCYSDVVIPNAHRCVGATSDISSSGNGSDPNSCMSCDPTYASCASGCQRRIDYLYRACDGICLPDGYYFDPKNVFSGCWADVMTDMKIQVERCGCNAAPPSAALRLSLLAAVAVLAAACML